jgi:hypothetical protein
LWLVFSVDKILLTNKTSGGADEKNGEREGIL